MAKIKVLGTTAMVISTLKKADIEKMESIDPEALVIYEGEGKEKEPVFKLSASSNGSVGKYGIAFNAENRNGDAMVTVELPSDLDEEALNGVIVAKLMAPVSNLEKLEAVLPEKLQSAIELRDNFVASIEFE